MTVGCKFHLSRILLRGEGTLGDCSAKPGGKESGEWVPDGRGSGVVKRCLSLGCLQFSGLFSGSSVSSHHGLPFPLDR